MQRFPLFVLLMAAVALASGTLVSRQPRHRLGRIEQPVT
jgi:hypothetical protein